MLPRRDSKPLEYPALLPMFGGMEKKPRILDREVITMGRARGSDFCLDGNEVSALHCIIYRAVDGFRVRDCGSRTGTRVNGQSVKTSVLNNGDVLQIGPFSFEVRLPRGLEALAQVDPIRVEKLQRSRSHLVHLALRLRRKLLTKPVVGANGHAAPGHAAPADAVGDSTPFDKRAAELKAKIKQHEQRVNQLEESEKELFDEQEALKKQKREFEDQMAARETELNRRCKQLEDEFQQRWKTAQAELDALREKAASVRASVGEEPGEDLAAKKKELEALEKKLKARDKELNDDYKEILKERDQLEKLRQQWEQEQTEARQEFERQRETISSAEFTLNDQKSQLGTMIEQLRSMQDQLRATAQGETASLQQQVAQLKRELADARSGRASGMATSSAELDEVKANLAAAKEEIAALTETLQNAAGLNGEVENLQKDLQAKYATLEQTTDELRAENESLRGSATEIELLRGQNAALQQLAEELRQRIASDEIESLKNENIQLRASLARFEGEGAERPNASAGPEGVDEIRDENQVLRRLLQEAESELAEVRKVAAEAERPAREAEKLRNENDLLHKLLHEKDAIVDELKAAGANAADPTELSQLRNELRTLEERLREKEELVEELKRDAERIPGGDPDGYEAELNRFRKELEQDRTRLNKEIESLRFRNQELDEATREMEMELSRERAEMARERIRLDRLRDEVKADMERLQREQEVRGTLGSVQKLRDELKGGSGGSKNGERLRSISKLP